MAKLKDIVLKHALLNAVEFGRAEAGPVIGKVIAEYPESKKDIAKLKKEIASAIEKVNKMSKEKREKELKKFGKIKKPEKKEREGLPELPGARKGKVVLRFAPEPNGYLHIGHLKSALLNYLYAKMYKGKLILRWDDTNPKREKKEYYDAIRQDLKTFGVKYDKEAFESDNMELFYKHAEELLKKGNMYVCDCPQEAISSFREQGKACPCRERKVKENMELWKKMLKKGKEDEMMVKLKTDPADPNPALREPSMLRVVETPHPLKGKKYRVYPLYNFACTIMDHDLKITHVLRDKGFENDARIQGILYSLFGWPVPVIIHFGRLKEVAGIPMSKRKIRLLIEEGRLSGWDDLRIPNPRNLLKRGFMPDAIRRMVEEVGPSKHDITITMDMIETYNRQLIDKKSNRYFFVGEPVELKLDRLVMKSVRAPIYPGKRKYRKIPTSKKIFIDKMDYVANREKEVRLMHFCNIRIDRKTKVTGKANKDIPKIHWVPSRNIKVKLIMPDGRLLNGLAEPEIRKVKINDTLQFERVGFVRVDKVKPEIVCYYAHR
ncbi:MAG: glutamate--tRNA ligase [Candidatus Aenigmatarchaeota archaeon]